VQESRWSDGFAVSMRTECWSIGTRNKTRSARMPGHPLTVHIESNPITTLDRKTEETYRFLRQQTDRVLAGRHSVRGRGCRQTTAWHQIAF
jgi:hypothetical protein